MRKFTVVSLLSLTTSTFAVPLAGAGVRFSGPYPTKAIINRDQPKGTAIGGAMSTFTGVPKAIFASANNTTTTTTITTTSGSYPPEFVTITVINSYGSDITTSHSIATGAPTPISGDVSTGTMTNGETAAFAVPTGWIGNIAVNDAKYATSGDDSLIEANFVIPYMGTVAVVDVDISYVDGFSVPIVCSCNDVVVTGCTLDLFSLSTCPNNDGQNACVNPLRADNLATSASDFFAPCAGMAYTFPNDSAANSMGACQTGQITCCIGTDCPANPKQG
ncbi:hypothetical protein BGW36DRAFT_432160 [Talaromyces proteolyticus]|uniref:Thaumatin-like protein n=1 Tax=Talaromyces proteolyticus TaxID=1131652 RepID=A0AAD4PW78_9EURO|nr:uncharacterized protein BGW36DRAFT_432160 [Talaromyces proteolyticus]KAH8691612.1 hypothetical protein BGW36DRAFT_432160 [Talaromyces proteolyticus]